MAQLARGLDLNEFLVCWNWPKAAVFTDEKSPVGKLADLNRRLQVPFILVNGFTSTLLI